MSRSINYILNLSRPRFWIYLAGPFLIGFLAGSSEVSQLISGFFVINFLYFLLPANLLLYGINDYFDGDTDRFNKKKGTKEVLLKKNQKSFVTILLLISSLISIPVYLIQESTLSKLIFALFIFLSFSYSAPPLRFKTRMFLDSISNVLYILPGVLGCLYFRNDISWEILLGSSIWVWSMHLFSAIPDIKSDQKAGLATTAVYLGERKSLYLCSFLWAISAGVLFLQDLNPFIKILGLIYSLLPVHALFRKNTASLYWAFPFINLILGFFLFVSILIAKQYL